MVCSQLLYNHLVSLGTPSSGPIWVVTKVCEPKFIHDSEGCLKFWNCLKNINKVSTCTVRLPWTVWTQGKHRLNSSLWVLWIESPVLVHLNSKMEVVAYIHVYLLNSRLVNGLDRIEVFMTNHDQDKHKILGSIRNVDRTNTNKAYWKLLYLPPRAPKCRSGGSGRSPCRICSLPGVPLSIYPTPPHSSLKSEVHIYNIAVKSMCYNAFFSSLELGIFSVGKLKFYDVKIHFIYLTYCMPDYIK